MLTRDRWLCGLSQLEYRKREVHCLTSLLFPFDLPQLEFRNWGRQETGGSLPHKSHIFFWPLRAGVQELREAGNERFVASQVSYFLLTSQSWSPVTEGDRKREVHCLTSLIFFWPLRAGVQELRETGNGSFVASQVSYFILTFHSWSPGTEGDRKREHRRLTTIIDQLTSNRTRGHGQPQQGKPW